MTDGGAARPIPEKRRTVCPGIDHEIFARRVNFATELVRGAKALPE